MRARVKARLWGKGGGLPRAGMGGFCFFFFLPLPLFLLAGSNATVGSGAAPCTATAAAAAAVCGSPTVPASVAAWREHLGGAAVGVTCPVAAGREGDADNTARSSTTTPHACAKKHARTSSRPRPPRPHAKAAIKVLGIGFARRAQQRVLLVRRAHACHQACVSKRSARGDQPAVRQTGRTSLQRARVYGPVTGRPFRRGTPGACSSGWNRRAARRRSRRRGVGRGGWGAPRRDSAIGPTSCAVSSSATAVSTGSAAAPAAAAAATAGGGTGSSSPGCGCGEAHRPQSSSAGVAGAADPSAATGGLRLVWHAAASRLKSALRSWRCCCRAEATSDILRASTWCPRPRRVTVRLSVVRSPGHSREASESSLHLGLSFAVAHPRGTAVRVALNERRRHVLARSASASGSAGARGSVGASAAAAALSLRRGAVAAVMPVAVPI